MTPHFYLKPSYQFASLLLTLFGGACYSVLNSALSHWIKIPLLISSFLYGYTIWRKQISLKSPQAITCFWQDSIGIWKLCNRQNHIFSMQIKGEIFCISHMILLNFTSLPSLTPQSNRAIRKTVILFNDSLPLSDLKALRRLLLWGKAKNLISQ
jgi:hypothetical protein